MASVNKVILLGNVGQDPEIRYTTSGEPVANFSIATTDQWKDKNGEKQERTEWHRIVAYKKMAEIIGQYVKKGDPIFIEGSIQSNKYKDKEGIERTAFQIRLETMRMLGSRGKSDTQQKPEYQQPSGNFDDFEDDIPY
jgi:single-strand DNA-binding protein